MQILRQCRQVVFLFELYSPTTALRGLSHREPSVPTPEPPPPCSTIFRYRNGVKRRANIHREGPRRLHRHVSNRLGSVTQTAKVRIGSYADNLVTHAIIAPKFAAKHRLRYRSIFSRMYGSQSLEPARCRYP